MALSKATLSSIKAQHIELAELRAFRDDVRALIGKLRLRPDQWSADDYLGHATKCTVYPKCNCGFDQIMKEIDALTAKGEKNVRP